MMSSRDSILNGSIFIGILLLFAPLHSTDAAIVSFELTGNAGTGLLPGNENPPNAGGTGGLGAGGITYDTDTNILSVDIAWGSVNGFTDLTSDVSASHIHGFTAGPPTGWSENAGVLYPLPRYRASIPPPRLAVSTARSPSRRSTRRVCLQVKPTSMCTRRRTVEARSVAS